METRQIAVVVDAAIELPPQYLQELGILVVSRIAKIGGHRQPLTTDYTGYSVAKSSLKPRPVDLADPSFQDFQQIYTQALDQFPHVLSIHTPAALDSAAAQARKARNLLSTANVTIFEPPLVGLGLAKLVESAAVWSQQGETPTEIVGFLDSLLSYVQSFLIAPPSEKLRGHLQPGYKLSTKGIFFSSQLLALSVDRNKGFKPEGQLRPPTEISAELQNAMERIPEMDFSSGAYLNFIIRSVGMEVVLPHLRSWLSEKKGSQKQSAGGWSPALSAWLGQRYVEILSFPTDEAIVRLKEAWKYGEKLMVKPHAGRLSQVRLK